MVFSSNLFIFYFLPVVLLVYYAAPRRARHALLTVASYAFYGWANPLFMLLMLFSTCVDYLAGLVQAYDGFSGWGRPVPEPIPGTPRSRTRRLALAASIVSNLSLLGFFKYFTFAAGNYNVLLGSLGLEAGQWEQVWRVTLPLGISFYTFQSMSYSIDVFRGQAKPLKNFVDFACYVAMFPQLVAGPIVRFSEVAQQLVSRTHTVEKFARGVAFFSLGLAKKVLLANPCGAVADAAFEAASLGWMEAWYGVTAYAFQIYFDFSGYSDMAIGLGLMFGFTFAKNFDSPYQAGSVTEFWRRWHISLSTWLRDYLYVPLGGNRQGPARAYTNLFVVMALGGLWHGAAWNFVIWGLLHGGLLALERGHNKQPFYARLPRPMRVGGTFVILLFTWVFFRSPDLAHALRYCASMLGLVAPLEVAGLLRGVLYQPYHLLTMAVAAVVVWAGPQTWDWTGTISWRKAVLIGVLFALSAAVLATQAYNPFIYFFF